MSTVRRATEEDLDAVLAVGHATWPVTYEPIAGADYVRTGLATWWTAESTLAAIRGGRVLVAETNGDVVGMASYSLDNGALTLWKLYVLPTAQGSGAGSALLAAVEAEARELMGDQATQQATQQPRVRLAFVAGNDAARGFYESRGFTITSTEAGPLGGPDNVWLEKTLSAP